ncbi:MAG TPA: dihydrolipoyl dehydrogenase [Bacillales bacterium]|nr:dihydrolipoyl dehydrogenase [Bacillales bacterium]
MAKEYDLVVLGGGTGGYVAAIRASQLGLKTAIVEKDRLGGTCLHRGCIPSKALLRSAEVYATAKNAESFGINVKEITLDYEKAHERKKKIIDQLHNGVRGLLRKGKIDVYEGTGRILGPSIFSPMPGTISVEMNNGEENEMLVPKNVIVATGSRPRSLPGLEIDGERVLTSDEAVNLDRLPESIIIVGGGVIGIEWASMFADFGVSVTILEYADRILPLEDEDISSEMTKLMRQKGVNIVTEAKVLADTLKIGDDVKIEAERGGKNETFAADKMLVSVGRAPNIEGIGLENSSVKTESGFIQTNDYYQTAESHIYAIGDVVGGLQLAHAASHEGIVAVEHMCDQNPQPIDETLVPRCVYSRPETASVGLTEKQALDQGYDVKIGKFPFAAIGKALIYGESDGFVKLVSNKKNDDLLGVHMVGPHVTDMISEAALARVLDAASWEVAETIHPHPSLAEIIGEAALAVDGKAIHY